MWFRLKTITMIIIELKEFKNVPSAQDLCDKYIYWHEIVAHNKADSYFFMIHHLFLLVVVPA